MILRSESELKYDKTLTCQMLPLILPLSDRIANRTAEMWILLSGQKNTYSLAVNYTRFVAKNMGITFAL